MTKDKTSVDVACIWDEFSQKLRRFIAKRVNNKDDITDILQEVFVKIHSNIDKIKSEAKIAPWIYQITRNAIIDYYRNRSRNNIDIKNYLDFLQLDLSEKEPPQQISKCLQPFIEALPPKYREALILTELQGLSQKEVALKLGLSISGAKSRIQRSREKLKTSLLKCCHFVL